MQVIRMSKVLELFSLSAGCMLQDESLQLVNRIEKVDTSAPVRVSRLEKPHVVSIVQSRAHGHSGRLSLFLAQLIVLLYALIHLT